MYCSECVCNCCFTHFLFIITNCINLHTNTHAHLKTLTPYSQKGDMLGQCKRRKRIQSHVVQNQWSKIVEKQVNCGIFVRIFSNMSIFNEFFFHFKKNLKSFPNLQSSFVFLRVHTWDNFHQINKIVISFWKVGPTYCFWKIILKMKKKCDQAMYFKFGLA